MPFISMPRGFGPDQTKEGKPFVPKSLIDILYSYEAFLRQGPIATSGPSSVRTVAVIGTGAAGLAAAYELSKVYNINVVVYEANEQKAGGRMDSIVIPDEGYNPKVFEMGCMRFPPTSHTLYHYFEKFKLNPIPDFPDPGHVPTKLYYENTVIEWPQGQSYPCNEDFIRIGGDFSNMLLHLLGNNKSPDTVSPSKLFDFWAIYQGYPTLENKAKVIGAWQKLVDRYKDTTYYKAVFDLAQDPSIVKQPWTQEDMNKFGALGVGSGGFGPLYVVNFVEILRLFANGWEDNQELLQEGIVSLVDNFVNEIEDQGGQIYYGKKVTSINKISGSSSYLVTHKDTNGYCGSCPYDAVIVATTTRAMEYMGLTLDVTGYTISEEAVAPLVIDQGPKVAIRNLHLMNSSKLFVTTKTKFWYAENNPYGEDLPFNMQSDELFRGLYCLDYDSQSTEPGNRNTHGMGVVLLSYVWGDDSSKLLALSPEERFLLFCQDIMKIDSRFASLLMKQYANLSYIDWENTPHQYGAFKLNYPGQEQACHDAFFQYQNRDQGLFLAGDSVSWAGGWVEGALTTGINAACAAANYVGAALRPHSPLTEVHSDMFTYDNQPVKDRKFKPVKQMRS